MTTLTPREALARLIELDEKAPTGFEIGTDPQWTSDWHQVMHHARQALTPKIVMNQEAWLNVAICAAQRSMIAVQEANRSKPESSERRLHNNREIDEWSTVNMAFNRAARTRVLLDSCTFRWMFDYSELDQSVIEESPVTTSNHPSPDAQAVLNAFDRCGDNWPQALATALYAAAHHLSHDRRQLAAIATELEGHHV